MTIANREATFANQGWYPSQPGVLDRQLAQYSKVSDTNPITACGVVSPHAGYRYSGAVAGALFASVRIPDVVVVLAVNHRGFGHPASVWNGGDWEIPGDTVKINRTVSQAIIQRCPFVQGDTAAHIAEHSAELQLPFLHYHNPKVTTAVICLKLLRKEQCIELGVALAELLTDIAPDSLIVASSDLNHYEDQQTTLIKDQWVIDRMLALDPEGLYETVAHQDVSMCGFVPVTVTLAACRSLGANHASLIRHTTSADVSGDFSTVVGYAGIRFVR